MIFKPTYLYVKTHNQTGLKYFGKTTQDPFKYNGSGKYWKRHLEKHGFDVSTEIIGYYEEESQCIKDALRFSQDNLIVSSEEWANLKNENGIDGWSPGPMSEEIKEKLRKPKYAGFGEKVSKSLTGHRHSHESKLKMSQNRSKESLSQEHKKKISDSVSGEKNGNYGRPHTLDERQRMSENRKGKGIGNKNGCGTIQKIPCDFCNRMISKHRMWFHLKFCEKAK